MPVFFVVATGNPQAAQAQINVLAPEGSKVVKADSWFVEFNGTSKDLAEKIGFISGAAGGGIVVPVTNYSGRAPADTWEWLAQRLTKAG